MTEIFRIVNGSKLYGLDTPESDDDFVAVYVETPETVFSGSHRKSKRYGSGTKKTQPGEEDGIGGVGRLLAWLDESENKEAANV